uniref:Uncharacterized protein n=1 Tax=Timema douglasi TaxID=61478 RepID=A0A7R8VZP3_TIMDO|nr:unnamed protein product [Timema douglasi]
MAKCYQHTETYCVKLARLVFAKERQDMVKTTILLNDIADFGSVNEVYKEFFKEPYPARTAYQAGKLPLGANVEIEVIAITGEVETSYVNK